MLKIVRKLVKFVLRQGSGQIGVGSKWSVVMDDSIVDTRNVILLQSVNVAKT